MTTKIKVRCNCCKCHDDTNTDLFRDSEFEYLFGGSDYI